MATLSELFDFFPVKKEYVHELSKNDLVFQSNLITLARQNFTPLEKQVMFAILKALTPIFKNSFLVKEGTIAKKDPFPPLKVWTKTEEVKVVGMDDTEVTFENIYIVWRVEDMNIPSEKLERYRSALTTLTKSSIELYDEEKKTTMITSLLHSAQIKNGLFAVQLSKPLYKKIFNVSKGYTAFDFETAISFKSVYTMRIYELLSMWKGKGKDGFDVFITDLKNYTNTNGKYNKNISLFRIRVLDHAKAELDNNTLTDLRFEYTTKKQKNDIVEFHFTIIETERRKALENELRITEDTKLSPKNKNNFNKLIHYLWQYLQLRLKGKNFDLIRDLFDLYGDKESEKLSKEIAKLTTTILGKNLSLEKRQAYFISSCKNMLNREMEKKAKKILEKNEEEKKATKKDLEENPVTTEEQNAVMGDITEVSKSLTSTS